MDKHEENAMYMVIIFEIVLCYIAIIWKYQINIFENFFNGINNVLQFIEYYYKMLTVTKIM